MSWTVYEHNGVAYRLAVAKDGRGVWVGWPGGSAFFEKETRVASGLHQHEEVRAPMTGKVVQIRIQAGDAVAEGDVLIILEAMKMEYHLAAPHAGTVEEVHCHEGDLVELGHVLVKLVE